MKSFKFDAKSMVLLGLLTAIIAVFSFTPIGSIPVGPLVITLNIIPIAIAAISLGPVGGAIIGGVFGIFSFLQCFGIGIPSGMGAILVEINPFFAFIQRFVPRLLDGFLAGLIFRGVSKLTDARISCFITGFFTALMNTAFFMFSLVFLFGNTEYVQGLMKGKSVIPFIISFVGVNALVEMIVCTIITGAVGTALFKAKLIKNTEKKAQA
ncbi:MAG: ECF transporter S component [Ruminococcus sp.]|nr:ECF transporter S component [Ruminococcus sp.]MBP5580882.1 ECF transporter S component [Ruminococcus sp.]